MSKESLSDGLQIDAAMQHSLSRRRLLLGGASLAAVPFVGFGQERLLAINQIETTDQSILEKSSTDTPQLFQEDEHAEEHASSTLNDISAYAITAAFSSLVGVVASEKATFGPKTAAIMTSLGATRVGLLAATDAEGLKHEIEEHIGTVDGIPTPGGYPLLPVLVALADFASHVKAENDEIFKKEDVAERLAEEVEAGGIFEKRPDEGDSKETWVRYYRSKKNEVIEATAQNAALTSVVAPITTTYTSASIAQGNFKKMLPLLKETHYAKRIVEVKESQESTRDRIPTITPDEIEIYESDAEQKALQNINGKDGYIHLNIALSTNLNGALGIGDPPLLYFFMRHRPDVYAKASLVGLGMSEIATLTQNYAWISRSLGKQDAHKFFTQFLGSQLRATKAIWKSFTDGQLRDVSFGGASQVTETFVQKLEELDKLGGNFNENAQELRHRLNQTDHAYFFFDVKDFMEQKMKIISSMLSRGQDKHLGEEDDPTRFGYEEFVEMIESDSFIKAFQADGKDQDDQTESLLRLLQSETKNDAVALLGALLVNEGDSSVDVDEVVTRLMGLPKTKTKIAAGLARRRINELVPQIQIAKSGTEGQQRIHYINSEWDNMSISSRHRELDDARSQLTSVPESEERSQLESVLLKLSAFENLADEEVKNLMEQASDLSTIIANNLKGDEYKAGLTSLHKSFSAIGIREMKQAMEEAIRLHEGEELEHHSKSFIGHQGQEVLWVLLSQLPAVPSLVHTVEKILPKAVGVGEDGPDANQLRIMTNAILASTAMVSAFADNVAAYLFAENILEDLYSKFYQDQYASKLKDAVHIAALQTAVVAGSLSKIGNGPNVTLTRIREHGQEEPLTLGSSLGNPYAITQTLVAMGLLSANIERSKP